MAEVGLRPEHLRPLSARVFRRSTPADRHRPGLALEPQAGRLRRTGLGPGCLGPGPGHQPAPGSPGAIPPDLPVHLPRSERRQTHQRPRGGHVSGAHRRDGPQPGNLPRSATSLHPGAALRRPRARSTQKRQAASSSPGTCRAPSIRRLGAVFTPAAATPRVCAPSANRNSAKSTTSTGRPATLPAA